MKLRSILILIFTFCAFLAFSQNVNTTFRSKLEYPGTHLANVWGYAIEGKEYALVGARNGTSIVDITDPDNPYEIVLIPGPNNNWKEIKTYKHYAYVVSEGGLGLQIIDLSNLPSPNLQYHSYYGDGAIQGQLNKGHALHVDTAKGFCYVYGSNINGGVPVVMNLEPDPYNPTYAGRFNLFGYVHDGYVDNDTMFACHIYNGIFSMVDMSNKLNPEVLATQETPLAFPHNSWISDDRKTIFTTDEKSNSFLAAYDVSDPDDIKLLDVIQSNPGSNSIVHNTHILNDFAVTSWYTDGVTIVDVNRPANMIQVGNYDTYGGSGGGFSGCWGVYPYFPSGNMVATNRFAQNSNNGELFVITPDYVRACYLEGIVKDGETGFPIQNATMTLINGTIAPENTDNKGEFRTGQLENGWFEVTVERQGYQSYSANVHLQNGQLSFLDVTLYPDDLMLDVSGNVLSYGKNNPVKDAKVYLSGMNNGYLTATDSLGAFLFEDVPAGEYNLFAYADNYGMNTLFGQVIISDTDGLIIELYKNAKRQAQSSADRNGITNSTFLSVSPNPSAGQAMVRVNAVEEDQLLIFDISGRLVIRHRIPEGESSLEVGTDLEAGRYVLLLEKAGESVQFIKN